MIISLLKVCLLQNTNVLIISVFHSVPGVPRVKMERFAGIALVKSVNQRIIKCCHKFS